MAYSYVRYTGNGSTTNYTFSFPSIDPGHIKVRVNGVLTTLFTFLNSSTIQMTVAPTAGAILEIRRETPKEDVIVNFTDGSVLLERDLDLLATYDLYLAQETKDGLDTSINQDSLGVWQGQDKRIANVADPVSAQDVATKNWSETAGTAFVSQSAASASAAATSASNASTSATNAASSASSAATSATSATASKDAAAISEANSLLAVTYYGATAPSPILYKRWISSDDLREYVYLNDGDSSQWVEVAGPTTYPVGLAESVNVSFQPAGTGAVPTNVQSKLREIVSVKDFGAVGDGVADDTAAVVAWQAIDGIVVVPSGNYTTIGSAGAPTIPRLTLSGNSKDDSVEIPFISIGKVGFGTLPKNHIFVQQNTSDRSDATVVQIQRVVNTDDSLSNPKALVVKTTKNHSNAQTEWAISGELDNYSNTPSTGETAVSGVSNKYGTASVFGGHYQAKDWNISALANDVTALIGVEVNTPAVGLDHPSANNGFGVRRGIDLIARTNEQATNWNTAGGNDGDAEIGVGLDVRTDASTGGYFRFGVAVREVVGNANKINTAIFTNASGAYGLRLTGANTTSSISVEGNSGIGLNLTGSFTTAAIRINSGQYIAMEATGGIKTAYGVTGNVWSFFNGATERVGFIMTASPTLRINSVSVVGTRKGGWTASTGTATRSTFDTATVTTEQLAQRVKALLDDITSHGLIGAS